MFDLIDWLRLLPAGLDVTETPDGCIDLHFGERSRLAWLRFTPIAPIAWLLGYYQAEGNKTGLEWSVDSSDPRLLARCADVLRDAFAIMPVDLKLKAPAARLADFEKVGVPVRPYAEDDTRNTGNLAVRDSRWFQHVFVVALNALVTDGQLNTTSREVQRDFALGYLDGDGNVTVTKTEISLRISGQPDEVERVQDALAVGFEWSRAKDRSERPRGNWTDTRRTLTATEIGQLLTAGAFFCSLNRGRLLRGWDKRLSALRRVDNPDDISLGNKLPLGIWTRWGLAERQGAGYRLTPRGRDLLTVDAQLHDELAAFRAVDDGTGGRKNQPYPLNPIVWPRPPKMAYQRSLADRLDDGRPRLTFADLHHRPTPRDLATKLIEQYEWLGDVGACTLFYGAWHDDTLVGVVGFGPGTGPKTHDICEGVARDRVIGLLRGACVPWTPHSTASWLIRHACRWAHRQHGIAVFFAYADEEAGEIGNVYQAAGWRYVGKNLGATMPMRPRYVARDRVYAGRYKSTGEYFYPAVPKHKYVWFEGSQRQRAALRRACRYPSLPYPKRGS